MNLLILRMALRNLAKKWFLTLLSVLRVLQVPTAQLGCNHRPFVAHLVVQPKQQPVLVIAPTVPHSQWIQVVVVPVYLIDYL